MFDDEESSVPPRPEEVPRSLSQKWEKREALEKIRRCRKCQKQVLASEDRCAYCGALLDAPSEMWKIVAVVLLGIMVFVILIRMF